MKIRDLRNGEWFWVNNAVLFDEHIAPYDYMVYSILASFGGMSEIRPTFETMAKKGHISKRQVKDSVKKLVELGFIEVATGGGRGRANVYNLLKATKGCTICTVYKGGKSEPERGQITHEKGAQYAPQKDIVIKQEKDTSAPKGAGDEEASFIKLFDEINPSYGELFKRKPQRSAAERLLKQHPLEWWGKFMSGYKSALLTDRFCPKATTPAQLEDKLGAIIVYGRSLKSKNKVVVV